MLCPSCQEKALILINELGFMLGKGPEFNSGKLVGCCRDENCMVEVTCIRPATQEELELAYNFSMQKGLPFYPGEYWILQLD